MYVPGNFPIIFLVMLKINSRFDSTKISYTKPRTSINIHHIQAMRTYHMNQGIPQLLLFLIMLMCNLMSPVKFAFLALFPSLPPIFG